MLKGAVGCGTDTQQRVKEAVQVMMFGVDNRSRTAEIAMPLFGHSSEIRPVTKNGHSLLLYTTS